MTPLHADPLALSTIAGSTIHRAAEVAQAFAEWQRVKARQRVGGEEAGRRAREASQRARSAILQALGRAPMHRGPKAGSTRLAADLTMPKLAATVVARIEHHPAAYGVLKAPSLRLVEQVLAELRREESTARG